MKKINIYIVVLAIVHLLLLYLLYRQFGFNTLNEGEKYLSRAQLFANGNFVNATQYQTFYLTYVSYLALFLLLKLPVSIIFLSTYCLSLWAYFKFYQFINVRFNKVTAQLWLLFVLCSPLIQYWQFNLFSESFFIAISLLFAYYTLQPTISNRVLKVSVLAVLVIFSRPSGIFTVSVLLFYKLFQDGVLSKKQTLTYLACSLLIMFLGIFFLFQLPYHDFAQYISNGSIYYGFPSWIYPQLEPGTYSLWDCYQFLFEQKGIKTIAYLFIKKFDSFFVTTRSYYSNFHNLINLGHVVFYPFALLSIYVAYRFQKKMFSILMVFVCIILLNALMIALIFNEWSERHTLHVFPYIMLLSAYALSYLYQNVKSKWRIKNG